MAAVECRVLRSQLCRVLTFYQNRSFSTAFGFLLGFYSMVWTEWILTILVTSVCYLKYKNAEKTNHALEKWIPKQLAVTIHAVSLELMLQCTVKSTGHGKSISKTRFAIMFVRIGVPFSSAEKRALKGLVVFPYRWSLLLETPTSFPHFVKTKREEKNNLKEKPWPGRPLDTEQRTKARVGRPRNSSAESLKKTAFPKGHICLAHGRAEADTHSDPSIPPSQTADAVSPEY